MLSIYDIKRLFESKNMRYEEIDNDGISFTEYNGKYKFRYTVIIFMIGDSCNICIHPSISFPNCSSQLYKLLNDLNKEYKYYKFVITNPQSRDDSYNLFLGYDIHLTPSLSVMELMEPILTGLDIMEKAYPTIQREVWR